MLEKKTQAEPWLIELERFDPFRAISPLREFRPGPFDRLLEEVLAWNPKPPK
jgi:hypothetical protein